MAEGGQLSQPLLKIIGDFERLDPLTGVWTTLVNKISSELEVSSVEQLLPVYKIAMKYFFGHSLGPSSPLSMGIGKLVALMNKALLKALVPCVCCLRGVQAGSFRSCRLCEMYLDRDFQLPSTEQNKQSCFDRNIVYGDSFKIETFVGEQGRNFFLCGLKFAFNHKNAMRAHLVTKTALHVACLLGEIPVVEFLTQSCQASTEMDILIQVMSDRRGKHVTPLFLSIWWEEIPSARCLLHEGALVNTPTTGGQRPIHKACAKGSLKGVGLCIEYGCLVNIQDHDGRTPLMHALRAHDRDSEVLDAIVLELLKAGTDPLMCDKYGMTAAAYGALNGLQKATQTLFLHHPHPASTTKQIIYCAAVKNRKHLAECLVRLDKLDLVTRATFEDLLGSSLAFSEPTEAASLMKSACIHRSRSSRTTEEEESRLSAYLEALDRVINLLKISDCFYLHALEIQGAVFGHVHPTVLNIIISLTTLFPSRALRTYILKQSIRTFHSCYPVYAHSDTLNLTYLGNLSACIHQLLVALASPPNGESDRGELFCEGQTTILMQEVRKLIVEVQGMILQRPLEEDMIRLSRETISFLTNIMLLVCHLSSVVGEDESELLNRACRDILQLKPKDAEGNSILHLLPDNWTGGRSLGISMPGLASYLLSKDMCPNETNGYQDTPLHTHLRERARSTPESLWFSRRTEICKELLSHGAHPDVRSNKDGFIPLDHLDMVEDGLYRTVVSGCQSCC